MEIRFQTGTTQAAGLELDHHARRPGQLAQRRTLNFSDIPNANRPPPGVAVLRLGNHRNIVLRQFRATMSPRWLAAPKWSANESLDPPLHTPLFNDCINLSKSFLYRGSAQAALSQLRSREENGAMGLHERTASQKTGPSLPIPARRKYQG